MATKRIERCALGLPLETTDLPLLSSPWNRMRGVCLLVPQRLVQTLGKEEATRGAFPSHSRETRGCTKGTGVLVCCTPLL